MAQRHDSDEHKGVVEDESPRRDQRDGRPSLAGQLPHRGADPDGKDYDSDFPEPGAREEHSGEPGSAEPKG